MNERELIDDILYRIEADQHGMIDWIDPVGRSRLAAPLEAANKEIASLREAVRVLAANLAEYVMCRNANGNGWINCADHTVLANPIARDAIEAAQKEDR